MGGPAPMFLPRKREGRYLSTCPPTSSLTWKCKARVAWDWAVGISTAPMCAEHQGPGIAPKALALFKPLRICYILWMGGPNTY